MLDSDLDPSQNGADNFLQHLGPERLNEVLMNLPSYLCTDNCNCIVFSSFLTSLEVELGVGVFNALSISVTVGVSLSVNKSVGVGVGVVVV